jgi:hypothetical protein
MTHFSFSMDDAEKYGVNAAIILHGIRFWCEKNEANNRNIHDGKAWTYNSLNAWAQLYPFFTRRQIEYALEKLKKAGAIEVGNFNKAGYDRTLWYSVTTPISQNCEIDVTPVGNERHTSVTPIPVLTSNNTVVEEAKEEAHEVEHGVYLTDSQYQKLEEKYGHQNVEQYAARLAAYQANNDKQYKNHYLTLNNWLKKDGVKPPSSTQSDIPEHLRAKTLPFMNMKEKAS